MRRTWCPVGGHFIFGYNVHLGLKTHVELADVFSIYQYDTQSHTFHEEGLALLEQGAFLQDFATLYKYYKDTRFVKFAQLGPHLFMVFRVGKSVTDIKTFKWLLQGGTLTYLDNRSDHEWVFPDQHEFRWKRTTRDMQRQGKHPHVSLEDRLFVETVGGDLTIKIEDNTDGGLGIYTEPVDNPDQTLDDADIQYAIIGNLIALKIRPYQEKAYRYIIYNSKLQQARRVDGIADSCLLLPDDHGLIFSNGYYLQTGEYKLFDLGLADMLFEKRVVSPNGEDFLYIFYNHHNGLYLLLPYNLIAQKVGTPITCHGYSLFENGEMCYFRGDEEAKKHHVVQIWQTPFIGPNIPLKGNQDSYLFKLGNKDIVRAMAEANELLVILGKDEQYANLYLDLAKGATGLLDSYHWLAHAEAQDLASPLKDIRDAAGAAIDEFEKVSQIRQNTRERVGEVLAKAEALLKKVSRERASKIQEYVDFLSQLRSSRGEVISLKELRYADLPAIEAAEQELAGAQDTVSQKTVAFLLKADALQPYQQRVKELETEVTAAEKVVRANELEEALNTAAAELEMLIEVVSNLKIEDATQTVQIIDNISAIYAQFNGVKAQLKRRRKELMGQEGKAEFGAQMKLVDQAVINYLDVCDTPAKCDEYLTRVMVQLEELEGRFSEFDAFVEQLSIKRDEVYAAFENRKLQLTEARNRRAGTLQSAAERILKAIQNRLSRMETVQEINGYYASDLMLEKLRSMVEELLQLGDTVKADDIRSKMKSIREEALRQLKDKNELYADGHNTIRFGKHSFSVNHQPLELSLVPKDGLMQYHLTGTGFFEPVTHEAITGSRDLWDQALVSENGEVYRAEYLAYQLLKGAEAAGKKRGAEGGAKTPEELQALSPAELLKEVQAFGAGRFNEGYIKGVHDADAVLILQALLRMRASAGLLRYAPEARACAALWWQAFAEGEQKELLLHQLKGAGYIQKVFPQAGAFAEILQQLQQGLTAFIEQYGLFLPEVVAEAASYLFRELSQNDHFIVAAETARFVEAFKKGLKQQKGEEAFRASLKGVQKQPHLLYQQLSRWLQAYNEAAEAGAGEYLAEASVYLQLGEGGKQPIVEASLQETLEGLQGSHARIEEGRYVLHYNQFMKRLQQYEQQVVPRFEALQKQKKELATAFAEELRLEEFKPRVMSSFVRNKLIDEVYLPLIGANLAKQIGTAGENKRTDLMGMLLLISPPGYGKTTIMEYIANRLGLIFMKINGPAIGHDVISVDPADARNSAARKELQKLNLAFEMGDNVMIYVDDIQHCNPEFLQKFISLCDAQRKIEGIWKGRSKTYDFRGRKVAVVMAGNPYTESGEKFKIPDMLANRSDIYNLGDIIGDTAEAFKLSYLENCLTSNAILARVAAKSHKDVLQLIKVAETGQQEGLQFEANHAPQEVSECVQVLDKLLKIRDVILRVNLQYIESAGQSDDYRTEPAFKLQGSYRNMNKLAEKVVPIMNEQELLTLLLSHYDGESQTLTTGAEANVLKLKELNSWLTPEETLRWEEIKQTFRQNNKIRGMGGDHMAQVLLQMENVSHALYGIRATLAAGKGKGNGHATDGVAEVQVP
nr:DNA repair ATPase [Cesiribacter andamanensis]